jgi:hypothetical protein
MTLGTTTGPLTFVVGSGRSGTSLLAAMLDAHPDLSIAPESHFLPTLIDRLPPQLTSPRHVDHMIELIGRSKWFEHWDLDLETLRTALASDLPVARADALRMIYRVNAAAHGKSRFGEKTPAYVYAIAKLAAEIDDARFIHIVRDGRNVALSFREASFGANDVEHSALNWQRRLLDGRRMGIALGPGRYIELRYEDLIADPATQLRRLCTFLDLDFDDAMLTYHVGESRWVTRDEETNLARPPMKTRDWRDQLTAREHARIELLAGKGLTTWGYELTAHPTIADRAAALRGRGRWWWYRIRSRTGLARRARTEVGRKGEHAVREGRAEPDV